MKRISLLVFLLLLVLPSYAQDTITKKDGTDVKAKILEVSKKEVKYKSWDNQDGPTFILAASEILMIRFENGTNQVMDSTPKGSGYNGGYFTSDTAILEKVNARYKALKPYYNKNDYNALADPRYGLGLPWLNLLIPGLAQYCMNEPGLGTTYLLLGLGSDIMASVGLSLAKQAASSYYTDEAMMSTARILFFSGAIAGITVGVMSIVNAYDVAKVKSLFVEDNNNYRRGYSFSLQPTMNYAITPNGYMPAPGLGLRVSF